MKTKIFPIILIVAVCLCFSSIATAQHTNATKALPQTQNGQSAGKYSFKVFLAPNRSFGYNIFKDNHIVFHQPAFSKSLIYSDEMLIKESQANKAALLAIEKMKKGQGAELSTAEIKKITAS